MTWRTTCARPWAVVAELEDLAVPDIGDGTTTAAPNGAPRESLAGVDANATAVAVVTAAAVTATAAAATVERRSSTPSPSPSPRSVGGGGGSGASGGAGGDPLAARYRAVVRLKQAEAAAAAGRRQFLPGVLHNLHKALTSLDGAADAAARAAHARGGGVALDSAPLLAGRLLRPST